MGNLGAILVSMDMSVGRIGSVLSWFFFSSRRRHTRLLPVSWGGEHSFLNHTSQYQNLFSITTSDRHGADLLCNLDIRTWSLPPSVFRSCVGSLSALAFLHLPSALAFLHFPFALHFLHSTLYSPFSRLSSFVFFAPHSEGCLLK